MDRGVIMLRGDGGERSECFRVKANEKEVEKEGEKTVPHPHGG